MKSIPHNKPRIHFIGIGGIGMSAIALILAKRGHSISGSDQKFSNNLKSLVAEGITIFKSQTASNIDTICSSAKSPPIVIISTAIPSTNPELRAAKNAGLEIFHRSDLLANLINNQPSIVIGGSHGKTTTSTIITTLLALTKQDPTAVIGGVVPIYKSNGHAGKGKLIIAEGDESDGTIVKLKGDLAIITNLELDHTNHYSNIKSLIKTMKEFGKNSNNLLANYDCPQIKDNFKASFWWSNKIIDKLDFSAIPIHMSGQSTIANFYEKGKFIGEVKMPLPGLHNLSNVTASIAACRIYGISFIDINKIIHNLKAPNRRFQFRGEWKERQIVDDYAHHPSEISATLSMSRLMINSGKTILPKIPKRIVAVFQPHRFSRTRDFLDDFANALQVADSIIIAPIYNAGEAPIKDINNNSLAECIQKKNPNIPLFSANSFYHLIEIIEKNTKEGDLILNMGAGDINILWDKLKNLNDKNKEFYKYSEAA